MQTVAVRNTSRKSDLDALDMRGRDVNVVRQRIVAILPVSTTNLEGQIACPQPNPILDISSAWALLPACLQNLILVS